MNKKEFIVEWAAGAVVVLIKNSRRERKKLDFKALKIILLWREGMLSVIYIF